MARFDFVVDTKPMADSVDSITGHVDATTAAVIAMQAAVINSEEQAAKKYVIMLTAVFIILYVHR